MCLRDRDIEGRNLFITYPNSYILHFKPSFSRRTFLIPILSQIDDGFSSRAMEPVSCIVMGLGLVFSVVFVQLL